MDVSQYLDIFIDETKEHLQNLNEQLLVLEREPENQETINEIFRSAHSLKGMAGTMGYKRMQNLTHNMENLFSEIRNEKMKVTDRLIDVLFQGLDALEKYMDGIRLSGEEGQEENQEIINELNQIMEAETKGKNTSGPNGKRKEEQLQEGSAANQEYFRQITFLNKEILELGELKKEGKNIFGLTVFMKESCILKAARAFLAIRVLEKMGEVYKTVPELNKIEEEEFGSDFSLIFVTEENMGEVRKKVCKVTEIQDVLIDRIIVPSKEAESKPAETKKEAVGKAGGEGTAVKQAAKPVINRSVRVDIEKLDILMNLVSELIIAKNGLVSMNNEESAEKNQAGFNEQIEYLERVTTNLHESVMKVRMVPIESILNRFPRMIRDLSKKLDKKMELFLSGEDTELDRTVIDEIGDPLMHLLRNAADHGLEANEDRRKKGKPEVGSIFLEAYQDGNNVVIEVRDDGAGIDIGKIRKKALEKGAISTEQAESMSEKEYIDLLFKPSFSTADKISDVSGRGVGLDVVKNKIEGLGGDIECRTRLGQGTDFVIRLPLTLAIIQVLMVRLGEEKYAIPLGCIQTVEDIPFGDIKYVQTREVIHLRGSVIPVIRLGNILDVETTNGDSENLTVVIVAKGEKLAGLVVDGLMGQQEIVIKSIGKYIHNNKIISGATILGDGEVALIIDANTLV